MNGQIVNVPSFLVGEGDTVALVATSQKIPNVIESVEAMEKRGAVEWVSFDKAKFAAQLVSYPTREQIGLPVEEQLIVELYSK